MGVNKYTVRGRTCWQVDDWLTLPDGTVKRFRKRQIPTREQAMALMGKAKAEAFEGRFFEREKPSRFTVQQAWEAYEPITKRDNKSWDTDRGRAAHLMRHLGRTVVEQLNQRNIDEYRTARLAELTKRGGPPSPASLDHEVALLKRMLNYAKRCGDVKDNPVAGIALLRKPNVRRTLLTEADFARLHAAADEELKPILLVAYDMGFRKQEVLQLQWRQLDLNAGTIRLAPQDTKAGEHRVVYMTARVRAVLHAIPKTECSYVFVSARTGTRLVEIRFMFQRAVKAAGLPEELWVHDLRRSFVTNARRRGIAESVVMRMSGHKTRSVFDRYNVVDEADLKHAAAVLEAGAAREFGQEMDKVGSLSNALSISQVTVTTEN